MTARRMARRSFDDGGDSLVPISRTGSMARDDQEIELSRPASMSTASSIESDMNIEFRKELELGLPNYDYTLGADGPDRDMQAGNEMEAISRPENFGEVFPGVYRSTYPKTHDYEFFRNLGLKTIVTLVDKELPDGFQSFMNDNGIRHIVIEIPGTKKVPITNAAVEAVMKVVLEPAHHPMLLHCNQGKHRTGCMVAVIRHIQGWPILRILDEYRRYAAPKLRETDEKFIAEFSVHSISSVLKKATVTFEGLTRLAPDRHALWRRYRFVVFALAILSIFGFSAKYFEERRENNAHELDNSHVGI